MDNRFLPDLDTPAQRREFVNLFTANIAQDDVLSLVFSRPLETEIHYVSAQEYAWWELALTGAWYQGQPGHARPHAGPLFACWCQLLKSTFYENFSGPQATEAQGHVLNLATMLMHRHLTQQPEYEGAEAAQPKGQAALKKMQVTF
ncbi:hypothetical protein ACW9KT_09765 [Hymenobacter sp. HD11105]